MGFKVDYVVLKQQHMKYDRNTEIISILKSETWFEKKKKKPGANEPLSKKKKKTVVW